MNERPLLRVRFAEAGIFDPESLDLNDFLEFLEGFVLEGRSKDDREEIEKAFTRSYDGKKIESVDGKVTNVEALKQSGRVGDLGAKMRAEMATARTQNEKLAVRRKYVEIAQEMKRKAVEGGS